MIYIYIYGYWSKPGYLVTQKWPPTGWLFPKNVW